MRRSRGGHAEIVRRSWGGRSWGDHAEIMRRLRGDHLKSMRRSRGDHGEIMDELITWYGASRAHST